MNTIIFENLNSVVFENLEYELLEAPYQHHCSSKLLFRAKSRRNGQEYIAVINGLGKAIAMYPVKTFTLRPHYE